MEENTQPQQQPAEENQQQETPAPEQNQQQDEQNQAAAEQQHADPKDIEENRAITYLSYLGLLFLVPMLAKKDSPFAQFHAKQGLVLVIISAVAWIIGIIPFLGWVAAPIIYIGILVLIIMGLINVSKGEMKKLPLVGDLAKKFNI